MASGGTGQACRNWRPRFQCLKNNAPVQRNTSTVIRLQPLKKVVKSQTERPNHVSGTANRLTGLHISKPAPEFHPPRGLLTTATNPQFRELQFRRSGQTPPWRLTGQTGPRQLTNLPEAPRTRLAGPRPAQLHQPSLLLRCPLQTTRTTPALCCIRDTKPTGHLHLVVASQPPQVADNG